MDNVEMQRAATALADRLVPPVVVRDSAAWYAAVDVALIALRAAHAAGRAERVSLLTASWDALATLAPRDERSQAVQALMDRLHQAIIEA